MEDLNGSLCYNEGFMKTYSAFMQFWLKYFVRKSKNIYHKITNMSSFAIFPNIVLIKQTNHKPCFATTPILVSQLATITRGRTLGVTNTTRTEHDNTLHSLAN